MSPFSRTFDYQAYLWHLYSTGSEGFAKAGLPESGKAILHDGRTGEIIWRLNGTKSDFAMGEGTPFAWQHDAGANPALAERVKFMSHRPAEELYDCAAVATGLAKHVLCFRSVWEGTAQGKGGRMPIGASGQSVRLIDHEHRGLGRLIAYVILECTLD